MQVKKEPIKRKSLSDGPIHELEEHHPSFAVANISRITGGSGVFFGSSVRNHNGYIELRIKKAHRCIDHGHERISSAGEDNLISIKMTHSQFAELITTHNQGEGIPVTLRYYCSGDIVKAPEIDVDDEGTESERVAKDFIRKNEANVEYFKSKVKRVEEIFEKKSVNKADKAEILNILNKTSMWLDGTSPYMVQIFMESMEKTVVKAKTEIDSFVTSVVNKTGIEYLNKIKLLGDNKGPETVSTGGGEK